MIEVKAADLLVKHLAVLWFSIHPKIKRYDQKKGWQYDNLRNLAVRSFTSPRAGGFHKP
jgi:hypothetical protein